MSEVGKRQKAAGACLLIGLADPDLTYSPRSIGIELLIIRLW